MTAGQLFRSAWTRLLPATHQALRQRGTVYVTLGRMEEKGYVTSRLEDAPPHAGGLPRRSYRATAQGRQIFAVWNRALTELAPRFAR